MRVFAKQPKMFLLTIVVFALAVFLYSSAVMADEVVLPSDTTNGSYSGSSEEPGENIGAYYDEVWEAAGFYSTGTPVVTTTGAPGSVTTTRTLRYGYNNLATGPQGKTEVFGNVSLPADAVVVEWKVAGHVHFASGL